MHSFSKVIEGASFSPVSQTDIRYQPLQLICLDSSGYIARVIERTEADYVTVKQAAQAHDTLTTLRPGQYVLPGFIDLHIHAPQWPNAGLALDRPLNEWLDTYTFPLEAKYQDVDFAKTVYNNLVQELLANGTTTALYFGTIHNAANLALAKACIKYGQRGFIGKVAMDNPEQTPDYYQDASAQVAVDQTEQFIQQLNDLNQTTDVKQTPVITPRFVPSCTPASLQGLGDLARKYDLPVQSHCSESDWENGYALEHYHMRDADVLDQYGLLTDKAVMAHGTQLNEHDYELFAHQQVAIAHCPISNVYFGNAVLPVKRVLAHHIKTGLGTDISGGYSPSLYQNIRQAVMSSRRLQDGVDNQLSAGQRGVADSAISVKTAFYLATLGGAESLHLQTGKIAPGYLADLQVVSLQNDFQTDTADNVFEKLMYQTTKNEIAQVYVRGKRVK
ncbi:guanine deaminase [Secundilactobacillus pentosiphilus]|uniref:Guanine deaminase n=1 Tax=Secundilactobacillus pentosiphilus TaxID=1714682 RepID=A0A1Z5J077_9LACO|nr:guanine deaminase [Secundilactobacillus pentosiphilus]GAX07232.1 guanine deaminase [Secundilactobacillus pentosiphilus]